MVELMSLKSRLGFASLIIILWMLQAVYAQSLSIIEANYDCVTVQNESDCKSPKRSSTCQWCINTGCVPRNCNCEVYCNQFKNALWCPRRFCNWFSNACQNLCPNLEEVEPRILKQPPVLEGAVLLNNRVDVSFRMKQMDPSRWNVKARFINPQSQLPSSVNIPITENPCDFTGHGVFPLTTLIQKANPEVTIAQSLYIYQFAIKVEWNEKYVLNGVIYPRESESILQFNIIVNRQIVIKSSVCSLDSKVLWAYMEKGVVYVPSDGSNPYIDFQLLTVPGDCLYSIDESTFKVLSYNGSVALVTKPVLTGSGYCGLQKWRISVYFDNGICSSAPSDSFTLQYTLKGSPDCSTHPCVTMASHKGQFTASLGGLENWCAINVQSSLSGEQLMFTSPTDANYTCCFFLGDTVYIRDKVISSGFDIKKLDIVSVKLSGNALIGGGPVYIYNQNDTTVDPAWKWKALPCPNPLSANEVCYKFLMREDKLVVDKQLDIYTKLRATFQFDSTRRSEPENAPETEVQTSLLLRNNAAKEIRASSVSTDDAPFSSLHAFLVAAVVATMTLAF